MRGVASSCVGKNGTVFLASCRPCMSGNLRAHAGPGSWSRTVLRRAASTHVVHARPTPNAAPQAARRAQPAPNLEGSRAPEQSAISAASAAVETAEQAVDAAAQATHYAAQAAVSAAQQTDEQPVAERPLEATVTTSLSSAAPARARRRKVVLQVTERNTSVRTMRFAS